MRMTRFLWLPTLLFLPFFCKAKPQPRLISKQLSTYYKVGDWIDKDLFVQDRQMRKIQLLDLIRTNTKVVVLIILGRGMKESPQENTIRGPLWCEDSFDDLPVQRALMGYFKNRLGQFIPVVIPPVYHADKYGWREGDFLDTPENSELYLEAVQTFILVTEKAIENNILPFSTVYYDPKFRLGRNLESGELDLGSEYRYDWQGKLRWGTAAQRYGTPAIWFLSASGQILAEPLLENDYDAQPPEINYGFQEARKLIELLLRKLTLK